MARPSAVCRRAGVGYVMSCARTALAWVGRCQQRLDEHAVHHHPAHGAENHPDETEVVCALRGVQRQVRLVPPAGTRALSTGETAEREYEVNVRRVVSAGRTGAARPS